MAAGTVPRAYGILGPTKNGREKKNKNKAMKNRKI
jgi:hypothetical protein